MQILVVGGGGREHALAWALARSPSVERVLVAPGNGGTLGAKLHPVADDGDLVALARAEAVDLVVIGPEAPLAAGLADAFRAAGVPCFGPGAAAAQLEASKAHAKAFMNRHGIPTAAHRAFTDAAAALAWPAPWPVVVKASGLAAGKGVIVPDDHAGAEAAIRDLFAGRYGEGGQTVVLEERLTGPELSILALCDGERFALLPPAQDHKRLLDGDRGPNTGGMGALAPSPLATDAVLAEAAALVARTLAGLAAEGTPYVGCLYLGLMLTPAGIRVLEYNCRFGDPETQVVLPLLDADLAHVLLACAEGRLDPGDVRWHPGAAVTVVAAAPGYPGDARKGSEIRGLDAASACEGGLPSTRGPAGMATGCAPRAGASSP
ncbi:MAG: phosphoribosylamine--glycine ligase [bacterium]